ncbi:hypothetical protein ACHAWT_002517 [Skeletonema menzelii]
MMSSPSVFRAHILLDEKRQDVNSDSYQQNKHSKKRRPVDPPEDITFGQINDYNDINHVNKRRRASPDDLFGTLSLKPPDPPAHSLCKRKKEENDDGSIGNSSDGDDRRYAKLPRCQNDDNELREGTIQSKRMASDETTQFISSSTKPDPPDVTQQNTSEIDNEMSIDDNSSINSNSDGSISEGSLQRAMYQAVFGRRNNSQHHFHSVPTTISGRGGNAAGCCYDAVDSKIEEIIRRSRIEAEIRSRKEEKQATTEEVSRSQDLVNDDEKMEMDG